MGIAPLCLRGALEPLRHRPTWMRALAAMRQPEWVVYAKRPFAGPQQVVDYVGRYTHRVAISNNRLLDIADRTERAAPDPDNESLTRCTA